MKQPNRIRKLVAYTRSLAQDKRSKDEKRADAVRQAATAYKSDPAASLTPAAKRIIHKNKLRVAAAVLDGKRDTTPLRIKTHDRKNGVVRG